MLAKKITWMMGSAIALTVLMVISSVLWTAGKNNANAARDSHMMVSGGVEGLIDQLAALNWDYAAWTAALTNSLDRNQDWMDENMGSGAGAGSFEMMQISWPDDWSSLSWTSESEGVASPDSLLPGDIVRRVHAELQNGELGVFGTRIFGISITDEFYILSAARIQPWQAQFPIPAEQLPVLFMGILLDPNRLAEIGKTYLIDDLALVRETTSGTSAVPIQGLDGTTIAYIQWSPPRPGRTLIRTATIPLAIALGLFFLLSGSATFLARRSARELIEREGEASKVARRDPLTSLPNRLAYNEFLAKLRKHDGDLAMLFVDVNGFKSVNDEHGHKVGDALIAEIGNVVDSLLGPTDFAARIGGDEFNLVCYGQDAASACERFCIDMIRRLKASVLVEGIVFQPEMAMGYSVGNPSKTRISELVHQADVAMYHAKNKRLRTPLKYDPKIEADAKYESEIVAALKDVMPDGREFEIAYQPIFDAKTGDLRFAEALLRWHSKSMGHVSPAVFIPIAERAGLITEIGNWVLGRVFFDMARDVALRVSINLSPAQLRVPTFVQYILELAEVHGVDAERVTFEITEGMLIDDPEMVGFILDALRECGFQIALDDFGTGFSSIGYLRRIKFDKLKIDKSFVDDLGTSDHGSRMMAALAYLAHALDMQIVAEGVETEVQLDLLRTAQFDLIQGYLLSRPISFEDVSRLHSGKSIGHQDFEEKRSVA